MISYLSKLPISWHTHLYYQRHGKGLPHCTILLGHNNRPQWDAPAEGLSLPLAVCGRGTGGWSPSGVRPWLVWGGISFR